MVHTADPSILYRERREDQKTDHRAQVLAKHQGEIFSERLVVPTFVKVLDRSPERPQTGEKSRDDQGRPANNPAVSRIVHLTRIYLIYGTHVKRTSYGGLNAESSIHVRIAVITRGVNLPHHTGI